MKKYIPFFLSVLILFSLAQVNAGPIVMVPRRICNTQMWATPSGGETLPSGGGSVAIATAGLVRCTRFTAQCTITATGIYWRVQAGAASQTCAAAIYNSTGTTLIATGPENTACTGTANRSATGLTPFTLVAGTEYLACVAGSGTSEQYFGNANGTMNIGGTNSVLDGQNSVATKAQFNADCTASTTPYPCCTGNTTGTCAGMPTSLGTMTAGANSLYPIIVVQ